VFPTPLGLEQIASRRDWDTLVDPPSATPRASVLPKVTSRNMESTRMALIKSGSWQVFLHYGQLTRSHSQAEALNYSAFYGDTDITHDTGTVGYGSPMHRNYYTRGANHNVPLVNGEGEDLGPLAERREWVVENGEEISPLVGELLEFSAAPARVAAGQPHYRSDAKARRTLSIEGDTLTDVANVESAATTPQKLGLGLHVQGKVRLPANFQADETFAKDRPDPFGYWRNVATAVFHDRAEFDVDYANAVVMHVTVSTPGEFHMWHGTTPDSPPRKRESFYVETVGNSATFTTTFAPAK